MNNMSPLYQTLITERKSVELEAELHDIRIANSLPASAGWTAHRIAHFAEWMIATGESLRQRYDHAAMHDCAPRTGALAN